MKKRTLLISIMSFSLLSACGGGDSTTGAGATAAAPVVAPGGVLPLGTTVVANASGVYALPPGARTITTRCTGQVILSIPGAASAGNACSSANGGSGMTNIVTGVASVTYTLAAGASARITVN